MNEYLTAKYLQFLRKSHHYTQEELAQKLEISRQAVSKWETGTTIPDLEVLLKISKLYDITINDILEPKIQPQRIVDFEQIPAISENEIKEILGQSDKDVLATALMGASPGTNCFFEKVFPDIDFEKRRHEIGTVRVERVEETQRQVISLINLHSVDGKGDT